MVLCGLVPQPHVHRTLCRALARSVIGRPRRHEEHPPVKLRAISGPLQVQVPLTPASNLR